ncbi:MAG: cytochrome c oxidase subunit II [Acidimicrobiia bacterium]|nr:cytochrome c oxidase subunit II [Acidimicrobiia bacterium]
MRHRSTRRRWWALAGLLGATSLLSACGPENDQNSLRPAGPAADKIQDLFVPVVVVATVIGVFVFVVLVLAVLRFRQRPGRDDAPRQVHGNTALEIGWTLVPALILAALAIPTVATVFDLAEDPGSDALEVKVVGKQWWWEFQYPEFGIITSTEMHIPAGRPVKLDITAEDVIHSFWIPSLAGKKDAVPGRNHDLVIEADEPGVYLGQCAEYCGLSHANMRMRVVAQTEGEFEAWVAGQRERRAPLLDENGEPAGEVEALITQVYGCTNCHIFDDPRLTAYGPNLTHLGSRTTIAGGTLALRGEDGEIDRDLLRRWILDAPSFIPMESEDCRQPLGPDVTCVGMPSFVEDTPAGQQAMTEADAEAIVDYLLSDPTSR